MCKDASGTTLQEEKDIGAQWLAEKGIGSLAFSGRGVWDAYYWSRRAGRQEGRLEKGPLDLL